MSVNKAILLGHVGKDPEVRDVSGNKVANFTLATTEKGYTRQDGTQVPERTEWHNIVVWGKLAEVCEKYVRKGQKLYLEGKVRTRNYDDKQGVKRYVTEVFVDSFEMCDRPQQQSAPQPPQQTYQPQAPYGQPPIPTAQPVQQPQNPYQQPAQPQGYQQPYGQPIPYAQPAPQYPPQSDDGLPF